MLDRSAHPEWICPRVWPPQFRIPRFHASREIDTLSAFVCRFDHIIGHEFVGVVHKCADNPSLEVTLKASGVDALRADRSTVNSRQTAPLQGRRVVGEINCRSTPFEHSDPIVVRNHAPQRTVLGIIGKNGCMAEWCTLPVSSILSSASLLRAIRG